MTEPQGNANYPSAMAERTFQDETPRAMNTWKPEKPGDHLIGKVHDLKLRKTRHGDGKLLRLTTDDGPADLWLSAGLEPFEEFFIPGLTVRIEYTGDKATPNGNMREFKVQTLR